MAVNTPIEIALDAKDPFVARHIHGGIKGHKRPSVIMRALNSSIIAAHHLGSFKA